MAVCEFCKTTLLKDAQSVANLGKMSEVLEDYSPLQIGASGRYAERAFSLIGRIQYRYSAGFWNEWYALFDDGSNAWLSDASGQFALTFVQAVDSPLPLFDKLLPGRTLHLGGLSYVASDVRTARCTAGQGELPFKVGPGWQARVADFRAGDRFVTLDYTDAAGIRVYAGQAVALEQLQPQLLRDEERISDAAGRFRGKISPLDCPSCGAPVTCVPGVTVHIVCPSCHAELDTTGPTAAVLAAGAGLERMNFTLALGTEAAINGVRYTLLGAMRRADSDDGGQWSEYLLYAPGRKFLWLVETGQGWQRSQVLDVWPSDDGSGSVRADSLNFNKIGEYDARVVFAAGSFNWRVSVGDTARITEFANGVARLAAEATAEELTWSRSAQLPLDQVRAWFGAHVQAEAVPHPTYTDKARRIVIALLLINAIPLLFATRYSWPYALFGAAAIYMPAYFFDRLDARGQ